MNIENKWCPYEISQPKTMKNKVYNKENKKKLIYIPFLWTNW